MPTATETTLPVYTVRADRETGTWLGTPEPTGERVSRAAWDARHDTDAAHFDTYEAAIDDTGATETRAVCVEWC